MNISLRTLFALCAVAWFAAPTQATDAPDAAPAPRPTLTGTKEDYWYFRAISKAKALASPEQTAEEQTRADAAWAHLFDPVDGRSLEYVGADGKPSNITLGDAQRRTGNWLYEPKEYVWNERARRAFRERGLKFWEDFPKDVRRYVWLFEVSRVGPYYWRDIEAGARALTEWYAQKTLRVLANTPIDHEAKARWEIQYLRLRADFLAATILDEPTKQALRRMELERRLAVDLQRSKMSDAMSEGEVALRWTDFCRDLMDLADRYPTLPAGNTPSSAVHFLETEAEHYPELYPLLKKSFLTAAKLNANDDLKDDAHVADAEPVELELGKPVPGLKFTTLKNQTVDRKLWHGKVVLLDFWAFWCHACLEGMPHIKKLHEKYRDQGLEVYGLCFAEKGETPQKIMDLMTKMEIPWPQAMREPLRKDRFGRIYSFTSLPQLMLIDKNGNLAARNLYDPAELEAKIQELLAQ